MPELPEVEHVRSGLADAITRRTLRAFDFARKDLRWPIPQAALRAMVGSRVRAVRRRGKWLSIDFAVGGSALVHLGMSGRVLVDRDAERDAWQKHEHWRMRFANCTIRGIDPRRFGALLHHPTHAIEQHARLADIGPEPLAPDFDAEVLSRNARGRRSSIKSYLLDGRNVAGVGNIYACEVCFLAGVRPTRGVQRIARKTWEALHLAVRETLERAIASGGTSLRDYVGSDGSSGRHQFELFVYGREGEACRLCDTAIRSIRQQGRSTFYCPACQKA